VRDRPLSEEVGFGSKLPFSASTAAGPKLLQERKSSCLDAVGEVSGGTPFCQQDTSTATQREATELPLQRGYCVYARAASHLSI
jgi:hypothetical protein